MVPVAKGAILLVLLGGATVSTYAVANGGFGNKAKSSEEDKQEGTGNKVAVASKGDTPEEAEQNGKNGEGPESGSPEQGEEVGRAGGESATGPVAGKDQGAEGSGTKPGNTSDPAVSTLVQ